MFFRLFLRELHTLVQKSSASQSLGTSFKKGGFKSPFFKGSGRYSGRGIYLDFDIDYNLLCALAIFLRYLIF